MKPVRQSLNKRIKQTLVGIGSVLTMSLGLFFTACSAPNSINVTGSSSMLPLMLQYSNYYDPADVNVSGGGSGKGIADIASGNTDIGDMSSDEQSSITGSPSYTNSWQKNNIRTVTIAIDAIGIVVKMPTGVKTINNKAPIVSVNALAELYDNNPNDDPTWSQLVTNLDTSSSSSVNNQVQAFGRVGGKAASGTSDGFFSGLTRFTKRTDLDVNHTLAKIKTTQEANSAAFKALNSSNQGVTYISLGYALNAVQDPVSKSKVADVLLPDTSSPMIPSLENAQSGSYSWTRPYNCSFSQNAPEYIKTFILWMLNASFLPADNQHFDPNVEALFNDAYCVHLQKNMVLYQINSFSKTDFELLNSSSDIDKNMAFGINLQNWSWQ